MCVGGAIMVCAAKWLCVGVYNGICGCVWVNACV